METNLQASVESWAANTARSFITLDAALTVLKVLSQLPRLPPGKKVAMPKYILIVDNTLYPHSPGQRLAFSRTLPSRLALRLLLVRLDCSTTHSRKGQAELSQKTIRGVKERHDRPTYASPTERNPYLASPATHLRYDSSL